MKQLPDKELVKLLFFDFDRFQLQNLSEQKKNSLHNLIGHSTISKCNVHTGQVQNECRHCRKYVSEQDFDIAIGYWFPNVWFICHKECVLPQKQYEAYECQCIDRNCNDCTFMVRDKQRQEKWNPNPNGINRILYGKCLKFSKDITFIPNTSSICDGFVHRKDVSLDSNGLPHN